MVIPYLRKLLESPSSLVYGFLFLVFFVPGLWLGRTIWTEKEIQEEDSINRADQAQSEVENKQINLLIINVDTLSSQESQLKAVWLAIYFPGKPDVSLIPIHPLSTEGGAFVDERIVQSFALNAEGNPEEVFFNELRRSIWWNHFVIVDDYALGEWIDRLGGFSSKDDHLDGYQVVKAIPYPVIDVEGSLSSQVGLMVAICRSISSDPVLDDFDQYLARVSDHVRSDMSVRELVRPLLELRSSTGSEMNCEFPTLDMMKP